MAKLVNPLAHVEALVMNASRFVWLGRPARLWLLAASLIVVVMTVLVLIVSTSPLYTFNGVLLNGSIGLTSYSLVDVEGQARVYVLESLKNVSPYLPAAALASTALVLPLLPSLRKPRIPRSLLELAVAGYVLNALVLALFHSALRVFYNDILSSILYMLSANTRITTTYSILQLYTVNSWYTGIGVLGVKLVYTCLPVAVILAATAIALLHHLLKYYLELTEQPPVQNNS